MIEYIVVNGEISVNHLDITFITNSSTVMVGDITSISLIIAHESPPEDVIVGVTTPPYFIFNEQESDVT